MSIEELTAIVYQYFPKGIDNFAEHERYGNSPEFKKLSDHCMSFFEKEQKGDFDNFYNSIASLNPVMNFHNATLFHWNDRCYNLQLAELVGDKHYSVCLNISTVIPYYLVYVLETTLIDTKNEPGSFGIPRMTELFRNIEKEAHYKDLMQNMSLVAETYFEVKPFSEELLQTVIPNIAFEPIKFGEFTFFNAFFLDKYHIRI